MAVTIWHNPRCSKSREALSLLRSKGVEPVIVEYLKTPPSEVELACVLVLLGMPPRDLMRRKEAPYTDLGLGRSDLGDAELVRAMATHPILIERPVVLANGKAALGRPPEAVLNIL